MGAPRTARFVKNRLAFDQVELGAADGLQLVGLEILARTRPPDAPPIGQGLVQGGGAVTWIGRKKVADSLIGGRAIAKPRALKLMDGVITAIVGYGFPARLVELGTVDTPAEPFLSPAAAEVLPDVPVILSGAMKRRLAKVRA